MNSILSFSCRLLIGSLTCVLATANGQTLLKDVRPGSNGSEPSSLINFKGTLFFVADDGVHGRELWKSDGTSEGTVLVKDVNPGPDGSDIQNMVVVNNLLFFSAYSKANNSNTRQLWRSDGTEIGTFEPYDGHKDGEDQKPTGLTKVGNLLFYVANGSLGGTSQWLISKSDGTDLVPQKNGGTGAFFVIDYDPVSDGIIPPTNFIDVNGTLFFTYGKALWKTVGQPADQSFTAAKVKPFSSINNLCVFKNKLYFSDGSALWMSDGTPANTKQVASVGITTDLIRSLTPTGDYLYIVAGKEGRALFASDGITVSKTPQAIAPGPIRAIINVPVTKLPVKPSLTYFMSGDKICSISVGNWSLKKLLGTYLGVTNFVRTVEYLHFITAAGLSRLEISTGKVESVFTIPVMYSTAELTLVGGRLYFSTVRPDPGQEVFYVNATLFNNNNPFGSK